MRIVIAYDQRGQIVTVAKVYHLPEDMAHPFADLRSEYRVLSIEEPEEKLRDMSLLARLIHPPFFVKVIDPKKEDARRLSGSRRTFFLLGALWCDPLPWLPALPRALQTDKRAHWYPRTALSPLIKRGRPTLGPCP
jgi:hypothetical protein